MEYGTILIMVSRKDDYFDNLHRKTRGQSLRDRK